MADTVVAVVGFGGEKVMSAKTINYRLVVPANSQKSQSSGCFDHDTKPIKATLFFRAGVSDELAISMWVTPVPITDNTHPVETGGYSLHAPESPVKEVRGEMEKKEFYFDTKFTIPQNHYLTILGVNESLSDSYTMRVDVEIERG